VFFIVRRRFRNYRPLKLNLPRLVSWQKCGNLRSRRSPALAIITATSTPSVFIPRTSGGYFLAAQYRIPFLSAKRIAASRGREAESATGMSAG